MESQNQNESVSASRWGAPGAPLLAAAFELPRRRTSSRADKLTLMRLCQVYSTLFYFQHLSMASRSSCLHETYIALLTLPFTTDPAACQA